MSERIVHYIESLSRSAKQSIMMLTDTVLLLTAVWLAYVLRLGLIFWPNEKQWLLFFIVPILTLPVFIRLGLYRTVIRYVGEYALWTIVSALTLVTIGWTTFAFFLESTGVEGLPRSVPFIFLLLAIIFIASVRFATRWLLWLPFHRQFTGKQVLIYGAGSAGRQLAASLRESRTSFPAGFIDDDSQLHGKDVAGLRVYSPTFLPALVERFDIRDVVVTLPSTSQARRREIVQFLEQFPIKVRILPALSDIANGKHLVNMLREVDIGDLLGRDPISADPQLLGQCITGKTVLVTGAGGSIGSELCKQIITLHPNTLILFEQNEFALYQIERILSTQADCIIVPILGSVKDKTLLIRTFAQYYPQTVYHAAAHKHVPLVEANIIEGVYNNIFGTWNIAKTAFQYKVRTFVLISTDKAVRPTNVMGATKRWAELVIQYFSDQAKHIETGQQFCAVRFGNVLGSSGSVIPLFKEQIANGGPITVTHPEIIRYFMSIHEAVELVIQAGSMAKGGDIFLLDMGEPVKIADLARDMIRLAGRTLRDAEHPNGDIALAFTGLRPGEKLYEELLIASGHATPTRHPKIMQGNEPFIGSNHLETLLNELEQLALNNQINAVKNLLLRIALDVPDDTALAHSEISFISKSLR